MFDARHKQVISAVRDGLKAAGIKARVRGALTTGRRTVQIITPAYGQHWTADQHEAIARLAAAQGLTYILGAAINAALERQLTGRDQINYFLY